MTRIERNARRIVQPMNRSAALGISLLACCLPTYATDDTSCSITLQARFVESAPRDRFEFTNASVAGWAVGSITVNLAPSTGKLVFDTAEGGKGVEVFQPFRQEGGNAVLSATAAPTDGTDQIMVEFFRFDAGETYQFSIDVDDRLSYSELGQIRVTGSEIEGATIQVAFTHAALPPITLEGMFDGSSGARVAGAGCTRETAQ